MTLWNPTMHPVTIHPHVPVTREYAIRDPSGNLVAAEVYIERYTLNRNDDYLIVTVSPNSRHSEEYSW